MPSELKAKGVMTTGQVSLADYASKVVDTMTGSGVSYFTAPKGATAFNASALTR